MTVALFSAAVGVEGFVYVGNHHSFLFFDLFGSAVYYFCQIFNKLFISAQILFRKVESFAINLQSFLKLN